MLLEGTTAWIGFLLLASAAGAAENFGYRTALFNGHDLDGWIVTGCDAVVENGVLLLKAGDGLVRTNERHGEFVLELDWKARRESNYDSGIYIRADLPVGKSPWPARNQINLKEGDEGHLLGVAGGQGAGKIKRGDWNHFKITAQGDTAELEINGAKAWSATGLNNVDGYIALQSEVDGGGQFEFRNIELTDLDYKPLFNGHDLAGWIGDTKGYAVEDGALVCPQKGGGNLYTEGEFSDFSFRFDFKLSSGGNNGVGIRTPTKGDAAFVGLEVQILDDGADVYKSIQPWQAHGSIYGVVPAKRGFLKPVGEWNHEEIVAKGRRMIVILNGTMIVNADLDVAARGGTIDHKPHPGLTNEKGHIGFLGHGARIEFRNMRIKELAASN